MAAQHWLKMALACEEASHLLAEAGLWRSSVSRSYYAAYCAIHSMLFFRGETPPRRGNWPHENLGALLHANLGLPRAKSVHHASKRYRNQFNRLIALRVTADYGPMLSVDQRDAVEARQVAGPFLRHAERMLRCMISNANGATNRDEIIRAVEKVLRSDPQAKQFDLHVLPDHVELQSYGWSIPIASGATSGSAYDLARAIEHAQELAERDTQQDLSLYLDLFGG